MPDKRLPATPGSPPATPAGFRQRQGLPATGMCCFPAIQLARSFVVLGCLGVATLVRTGLPGVGPRSGGESSVSGFQPQNRGFLPWRSNAELGPYLGEIGVCSWDRRIRDSDHSLCASQQGCAATHLADQTRVGTVKVGQPTNGDERRHTTNCAQFPRHSNRMYVRSHSWGSRVFWLREMNHRLAREGITYKTEYTS